MFIRPMLLERITVPELQQDKYKDNSNYYTEMKLDGIRLLLSKFNGKIRLFTRHHTECTNRFPELTNLPIQEGTILDGEVIVSKDGKPCFESMMERFMSSKNNHPIQYGVFDILYSNNESVMFLPLSERKQILKRVLPAGNTTIFPIPYLEGRALDYFNQVVLNDLEGIVIKKSDSIYSKNKRSDSWLKVINYKYETVYITKIRKDEFGAILTFKDGSYAGVMEFIPAKERALLYRDIDETSNNEKDKFLSLKQPIACTVKYRNLTSQGLLRIPSFFSWDQHIA
ncbi:ATP-dependent DNA ligase (plasmid) [Niallia taxi]|uniref:ATP-dependent DNA ligase n=1 Tax=Niallia taxi TaxID=2499688 RepID=UPI003F63BDD5